MAQDMFQTILKICNYRFGLFSQAEIRALSEKALGNETLIVYCDIREKPVKLTPEEIVRQLYTARLRKRYHYPLERIRFEISCELQQRTKARRHRHS